MENKKLIEKLVAIVGKVPTSAEVLQVRQQPIDELERRTRRFLAAVAEGTKLPLERSDWVTGEGRTLVKMTRGIHAVLYHASGAIKLYSGLQPMEALFKGEQKEEALIKMVDHVATEAKVREWVTPDTRLRFEKLWYIKACAATRESAPVKPVLCRVVGAYRQIVGDLPIWGPASMAVKVAADSKLDSVSFLVRETTGEVIDKPDILPPEVAAVQIAAQLRQVMGKSKIDLGEAAVPKWVRFGYLTLPKLQPQRLLAPTYIAAISIEGQTEAQGYIFAVPATETAYMPLGPYGHEAPVTRLRQVREETPTEVRPIFA